MTTYPGAIDEFRTVENLPGVIYDEDDTKTVFAEDANNSNDAIIAIETTLGTDPQGDFDTVAARLAALGGGGGAWEFVGEDVASGSDTEIYIDGLDIATDEAYLVFFSVQNSSNTTQLELYGNFIMTPSMWGQRYEPGGPTTQSGLYFISHQSLGPGVGSLLLQKTPNGAVAADLNYSIGSSRSYRMQGMFGNWTGSPDNLDKVRIKGDSSSALNAGSRIAVYRRIK